MGLSDMGGRRNRMGAIVKWTAGALLLVVVMMVFSYLLTGEMFSMTSLLVTAYGFVFFLLLSIDYSIYPYYPYAWKTWDKNKRVEGIRRWKLYFLTVVFLYGLYWVRTLWLPTLWNCLDLIVNTLIFLALFGLSYGETGIKLMGRRFWRISFVLCVAFEMLSCAKFLSSPAGLWRALSLLNCSGIYVYAFQRNNLWEEKTSSKK